MNPLYEKLYDCYLRSIPEETVAYDEEAMTALLSAMPLDDKSRYHLLEKIFDYYLLWTRDAFASGMQMGLRLMSGPGRKGEPPHPSRRCRATFPRGEG